MSGVTLTSAMRNNLLSLRRLSSQMDKTQEILSTGKKVNSAIDNASNFYQARSLTNRAADLMELLNSMDQGIRTIEAATVGLEQGAAFLEQATAVATEALTTAKIPAKEWFIDKVGANGAVVSTAQELKDAVAAGKETICVYGQIDLGDISAEGNLILKNNQKLVGIGYFGNFNENFSTITAMSAKHRDMLNISGKNCVISNLNLKYDNSYQAGGDTDVIAINTFGEAILSNINIDFDIGVNPYLPSAINVQGKATFRENINIRSSNGIGILVWKGNADFQAAIINTNCTTRNSLFVYDNGNAHIGSGTSINRQSDGSNLCVLGASLAIEDNTQINLSSLLIQYYKKDSTTTIDRGTEIFVTDSDGQKRLTVNNYWEGSSEGSYLQLISQNIGTKINVTSIKDTITTSDIFTNLPFFALQSDENLINGTVEYNKILSEYDKLIADSSYQGVNLLTGGEMDVTFNETRSHRFTVAGQDMSAQALGLTTPDWQTQGDIAQSLSEIAAALNSIRGFQAELGNHYGIILTRQSFTEALADVLETGADDLVLADMNEESANYLMLQTRQQLAVNSLSLAAQSAQSILSVF